MPVCPLLFLLLVSLHSCFPALPIQYGARYPSALLARFSHMALFKLPLAVSSFAAFLSLTPFFSSPDGRAQMGFRLTLINLKVAPPAFY